MSREQTSQSPKAAPITLEALREANIRRAVEWHGESGAPSIEYRFMELAGEVGEACNAQKKLSRTDMGVRGGTEGLEHLTEELADVLICLDLVAMDLGIDLGEAVRAKFNKTSEKYGLASRLGQPRQ